MLQPPVLLFDLDGTLIDSARDIAKALSIVREVRGGGAIGPSEVRPLVSHGIETVVRVGLGVHCRNIATDILVVRDALHGLAPDPAMIYPGVIDALSALAAAGHRMAIVTNKPQALSRAVLDALRLTKYFYAILGGDSARHPKPDPAPLLLALSMINGSTDAAMFIGDSDVDAAAAKSCGVPFLLHEAGYGAAACDPSDVDARFANFGELTSLVAVRAQVGRAFSARHSDAC